MKPEEQKRKEAEARQALWAQLTPAEQLAKLNALFPNGARTQKARIVSRMVKGDDETAEVTIPILGAANIVPLPTMKRRDRKKAQKKRAELNAKRRAVMEKGGV